MDTAGWICSVTFGAEASAIDAGAGAVVVGDAPRTSWISCSAASNKSPSIHPLVRSRDFPRVLEAEVRLAGPPLGLHGVPGGGGAAEAGLRRQGALPGEEPNHRGEGAGLPTVEEVPEDRGRHRDHSAHGETDMVALTLIRAPFPMVRISTGGSPLKTFLLK